MNVNLLQMLCGENKVEWVENIVCLLCIFFNVNVFGNGPCYFVQNCCITTQIDVATTNQQINNNNKKKWNVKCEMSGNFI